MSSTTPSATRNSASLDRLQVEKGRSWSIGRDRAIFLISGVSGRVNFGGRPPEYFAANESNPSALKLWMTSLTRSSEVKAILAMAGTSILEPTRARSGLFAIAPPSPTPGGRSRGAFVPPRW